MVNVNRNSALNTLQGLMEQSFLNNLQNMPKEFNKQQEEALELFKQRIFLDEVIERNISFSKKLNWNTKSSNVKLAISAEELIEVFKLRSDIYTEIGYHNEFPDSIEGLNFDNYDKNSAILYSHSNQNISGTLKVVFDSSFKLPSEEKVSFSQLRKNYNNMVELSRFAIKNLDGLNFDFKYLFAGVYYLYIDNDIDLILSGIKTDHFRMYSKFGGVNILEEMNGYGNIDKKALILSWDPSQISPFFKKVFLNNK